ncbi:transposase, partial [Spirosoma sp. 48-14]
RYRGSYRIDSARLTEYDYGSNGMYFITICTYKRVCYFGDIIWTEDGTAQLHPSEVGQLAIDCWQAIPTFFPFVELDTFQLMPNHLHGILWICKPGAEQPAWQPNQFGPQRQNLASIIRGYKSGVTVKARSEQINFQWQPRYYDRVIRNQYELHRIRTYIENNPFNWLSDQNNPENLYM